MEEDKSEVENLVIDTNVIFSSLVSSEGISRVSLVLLLNNSKLKSYIPDEVLRELNKYIYLLARKSKISLSILQLTIDELVKKMKVVKEEDFKSEIVEALNYVTDEKDAPFAGLAIKLKPSLLVTYNKSDYKMDKLAEKGVKAVTPVEALQEFGIDLVSYRSKRKKKFNLLRVLFDVLFELKSKI